MLLLLNFTQKREEITQVGTTQLVWIFRFTNKRHYSVIIFTLCICSLSRTTIRCSFFTFGSCIVVHSLTVPLLMGRANWPVNPRFIFHFQQHEDYIFIIPNFKLMNWWIPILNVDANGGVKAYLQNSVWH